MLPPSFCRPTIERLYKLSEVYQKPNGNPLAKSIVIFYPTLKKKLDSFGPFWCLLSPYFSLFGSAWKRKFSPGPEEAEPPFEPAPAPPGPTKNP